MSKQGMFDILIYYDGVEMRVPIETEQRYLLERMFLDELTGRYANVPRPRKLVPEPGEYLYILDRPQLEAYNSFCATMKQAGLG